MHFSNQPTIDNRTSGMLLHLSVVEENKLMPGPRWVPVITIDGRRVKGTVGEPYT